MEDSEFQLAQRKLMAAASKDFVCFLHVMWPQVEGVDYILSRLHNYLAELVQEVITGRRRRNQSVSVPPQHGKSRLLCVRAVAFLVGFKPNVHIAMTGFSHSLLSEFLDEVKDIIASPRYQAIFPNIQPVVGRNRAGSVRFTNGASIQVKSSGSKLTGRKVDWLIVDDPHAGRFEAESPTSRRKIQQWFFGDCVTRLAPDAKTFVISTRWHPEDLHGLVTDPKEEDRLRDAGFEDELFEVTNLPALAEVDDPLGRELGEALFPEQRDVRFLESLKARMGFSILR